MKWLLRQIYYKYFRFWIKKVLNKVPKYDDSSNNFSKNLL